jgi:hypothetical protein
MKKNKALLILIVHLNILFFSRISAENATTQNIDINLDDLTDPMQAILHPGSDPILRAIAKNQMTEFCVIDSSIVFKNDVFNDYTLKEIGRDYVILVDSQNVKLKLKIYNQ